MTPIFTIGIPVFNGEEWISDAVESALIQPNSEVIVCNDGSKDRTREILERYGNRIKLINQTNRGLASARNTIIMNMQGDWLLPLDADDILLDNCIEEIIKVIAYEKVDIIGLSFKEFELSNANVILMPEPKLDDFRTGNRLAYCSAIKKSALLEVGGYSSRMEKGYEDLHLWINMLISGKVIKTIPTITWLYRVRKGSMYSDSVKYHHLLIKQINDDFPEAKLNF